MSTAIPASFRMPTVEVRVPIDPTDHDVAVAELAGLGFDSFVSSESTLHAYIAADQFDEAVFSDVQRWLTRQGVEDPVEVTEIEEQNWNAAWEATIQPLAIGPFLVKPTWADVPAGHADRVLLEVDPKMSFGTGYHESTRLVLRQLPRLVKGDERVLDAGTGTGILTIAALKLGAAEAFAFDVSEWAEGNAAENFEQNDVAGRVRFCTGGIEVVEEDGYDLVLANINRNVLLDMLPVFTQKIAPGGHVVLAGLLVDDREQMVEAARENGLIVANETEEGEWLCLTLEG